MIQRGASATSETATMGSDVFAWLLNVSTSVMIVFVNKLLMDPNWGYRFSFATTLCALHFLACAASVWTAEELGFGKKVRLPLKDTIGFALIASVSIATLNLSLLVNSVGFYQISKLLIIPFVCSVEYIWLSRRFTPEVLMSIMVVVTGVGIVTVTDVAISPLGLTIAAISVVTSGLQQILCGTMQRKYSVTPNQLLSNTAPLQGVMLLLIGPYVDKLLTDRWILAFDVNLPALNCLALSCAVAVLVNISQFMCLGKFSAVTFQVLGHTKTVLVLVLGWLYLGDVIGPRKFLGMAMAVVGMMGYGYLSSQKQISAPQGPGTKPTPVLRFSAHSTSLGLHSTAADVRGGGRSKDKERSDDDDSELSSLESGEGRGVPLLVRGH